MNWGRGCGIDPRTGYPPKQSAEWLFSVICRVEQRVAEAWLRVERVSL